SVENISARPYIRRVFDLRVPFDISAENVGRAVEVIREALSSPDIAEGFDMEKFPPRVAFDQFNADSFNIKTFYWYQIDASKGRSYWTYLEHAHRVNTALFRALTQANIEFAFPTQTLYLAGDPARQLSVTMEQSKA